MLTFRPPQLACPGFVWELRDLGAVPQHLAVGILVGKGRGGVPVYRLLSDRKRRGEPSCDGIFVERKKGVTGHSGSVSFSLG